MKDFLVIAVTQPFFFSEEASIINHLLSNEEVNLVHIRKPEANAFQIENLLKNIDPIFYPNIRLHDHFELCEKYGLGGVHLNSRNPNQPSNVNSVSISLHSIEEIVGKERYDYYFISPIFDSISKEGYKANFDLDELADKIKGSKAIALGGVTPDKFELLKSLGFSGAAMIGHFFHSYIQ